MARFEKVGLHMKGLRVAEELEDRFVNDDLAIEILSRLPEVSIVDLKCVSKRWCSLLSSPSFVRAHFQRSVRTFSGLFALHLCYCHCCLHYLDNGGVTYLSMMKEDSCRISKRGILDFLPEKVRVIAECNGILLCRSTLEELYSLHYRDVKRYGIKDDLQEVVLYVCNPLTREWITIKPKGKHPNGCALGFAYHPYGSSTNGLFSFEVLIVQPPRQLGKDPYQFMIYSSKTGTWSRSEEVCHLSHRLELERGCYTNGIFYWLTSGHSVLVFDLEHEKSQVVKLPGDEIEPGMMRMGRAVGVSGGRMHYICCKSYELAIWVLEREVDWVLKHTKPVFHISEITKDLPRYGIERNRANPNMEPYVLRDDILYMQVHFSLYGYNIKTGVLSGEICNFNDLGCRQSNIFIPYCMSLLPVKSPPPCRGDRQTTENIHWIEDKANK